MWLGSGKLLLSLSFFFSCFCVVLKNAAACFPRFPGFILLQQFRLGLLFPSSLLPDLNFHPFMIVKRFSVPSGSHCQSSAKLPFIFNLFSKHYYLLALTETQLSSEGTYFSWRVLKWWFLLVRWVKYSLCFFIFASRLLLDSLLVSYYSSCNH